MGQDVMHSALAPPRQQSRGARAHTHARAEVLRMLREDHRIAKTAFRTFDRLGEDVDAEACERIIRQTCMELELHTKLEEEVFYPAIRASLTHTGLIDDAEVEHQTMAMLLDQVRRLSPGDARQAASFRVLGEYMRLHIKEEEGDMFRQISHARVDWVRLHEDMQARRHELMADLGEQGSFATLEAREGMGLRRAFLGPSVRAGQPS